MIDEIGIEYKIFVETFLCLKMFGLWKPTTIKQRWLQLLYSLYTSITSISIGLLILGVVTYIISSEEQFFVNFAENWCLAGSACSTLYECLNLIIKRKRIINFMRTKMIVECWTNLRDVEEIQIIDTSKKAEQNILRLWMSLIAANTVINSLNPIITRNPDKNLMFNSWLPCDRHVSSCFWICWSYQVFSYAFGSFILVSSDCLIFNSVERICSHVRILQHRLALLPDLVSTSVINTVEKERLYLIECIHDHQNIYSAAKEISKLFTGIVSVHFMLVFSILCTSIYLLSKQPLFSNSFIAVCTFLSCTLLQILIHCWYGYKLTQIGDDISYTIFSMNCLELTKDTRKMLRFIMLSTSKSIPLFNNFIVELSPEMFLKMLKISYSAFNLLQTRQ